MKFKLMVQVGITEDGKPVVNAAPEIKDNPMTIQALLLQAIFAVQRGLESQQSNIVVPDLETTQRITKGG